MTSPQHQAEERIAHLERAAEELSDEIARHSRQLDAIQRELARLVAREAEREAEEGGTQIPLADQRPPHW